MIQMIFFLFERLFLLSSGFRELTLKSYRAIFLLLVGFEEPWVAEVVAEKLEVDWGG
jgi:hypothetical protein